MTMVGPLAGLPRKGNCRGQPAVRNGSPRDWRGFRIRRTSIRLDRNRIFAGSGTKLPKSAYRLGVPTIPRTREKIVEKQMLRNILGSAALLIAGPALAQTTTPEGAATPQQESAATPQQSQQAATVDVAAVVDSEFPAYDADKSGDLSAQEFSKWMTTLKKAETATTGQQLGDQEIAAWANAAFAMADQDKSKAVSKPELVSYLGG
jgi:hypothetical protein